MALPIVGWVLPQQSLIKKQKQNNNSASKTTPQTCLQANLMKALRFPLEAKGFYQVDKNIEQHSHGNTPDELGLWS